MEIVSQQLSNHVHRHACHPVSTILPDRCLSVRLSVLYSSVQSSALVGLIYILIASNEILEFHCF